MRVINQNKLHRTLFYLVPRQGGQRETGKKKIHEKEVDQQDG